MHNSCNQKNTEKVLERLVTCLFSPAEPSPSFLNTLKPLITPQYTSAPVIGVLLNEKSQKAFSIYKRLPESAIFSKLVYVFLCLDKNKQDITEEMRIYLHQAALGIQTSLLNPVTLPKLRQTVNAAIYSIAYSIYSSGLMYRKLKLALERPTSLTHRYFLLSIKPSIKEYEKAVLDSPTDYLGIYAHMYVLIKKIATLGHLSDLFSERRHLLSDSSSIVNYSSIKSLSGNLAIPSSAFINAFPDLSAFEEVVFRIYNECTISYILTGSFEDPFSEFFISNHTLDYGLIPPFISKLSAETICYIGKYSAFLRSIDSLSFPEHTVESIRRINLSLQSSNSLLKDSNVSINTQIYSEFFSKYRIFDLLRFLHSTFLFGRRDFIEHLFTSLKESRKIGRKSISNILEVCLATAFPNSPFTSLVDIYISQDEPVEKTMGVESFSLYIKLDYPVTLLIDEQFVIKLVYIFKFLWKIMKIDNLAGRLKELRYLAFIQKLQFYVFNEVIGDFNFNFPDLDSYAFDLFKKTINGKLDNIMKRLFINTRSKKIEYLLYALEKYLLELHKNPQVNDHEIQKAFKDFYETKRDAFTGTYLFDIANLLQPG
ncbi:Gamma-tubulin complex component 3 [Glugoides intestinalis]